ncbi:unnamed protein product [Lathyrus sativus]|nr:unnamed protein product [Lathyrus sativus]
MEYLQTQFNKLKWVSDFNFHSKCEKLKIINLSFVYELLLFSRGNTKFVELMMKKFHEVSKATGLVVNLPYCKAYYGGVDDQINNEIQHLTSYAEGKLLFRYLSIPLTTKKLFNHHCFELVEKLVKKTMHWSNALLSYASRTQLIWSSFEISRKSLMVWKNVCEPKSFRGLNLISFTYWNKASLSKLLWDIKGKANTL